MAERSAVKARTFASLLVEYPRVDWISVTDNAGGNPQLAPHALGKPILYAGKEVVIHLTCKDLNRNGLESEAWSLNSEGFFNILAMTGDYPVSGDDGVAKPVFDLDSVGLISMLSRMNRGFYSHEGRRAGQPCLKTQFFVGAVATNFKRYEGEVMPQLAKLQKKIECGAGFVINQVGFDSRKGHELRVYMDQQGMRATPLIGNVYLLSGRVVELFYGKRIPGIVVTEPLVELCRKQAASPDRGKAFFEEFAAKQMAIYRGLGYRGVYLGGVHDLGTIERILDIERGFGAQDWRIFGREIRFSSAGEYFCYEEDPRTGLSDPGRRNAISEKSKSDGGGVRYRISKWSHDSMFTANRTLRKAGEKVCLAASDPRQGPKWLRAIEHASKTMLFGCKDCGDCSLAEIAFLCPESQCAKNQRNGPCGGTKDGKCEVNGYGDCIWLRAYERLKREGRAGTLLEHAPVVQNQGLRGTSAWANFWLGRDHAAKKDEKLLEGSGVGDRSENLNLHPRTLAKVESSSGET
jgi:methylenetetrahydrofolate reductase (NADPH)